MWVAAVSAHFCRVGLGKAAARQATILVDATFMGLQLDEPLDSRPRSGGRSTTSPTPSWRAGGAGQPGSA